MNLGEISVGTSQLVQLRLLTDPENCQGHAHKKNERAWRRRDQNAPEITLGMSSIIGGDTKIEHEQRHPPCEKPSRRAAKRSTFCRRRGYRGSPSNQSLVGCRGAGKILQSSRREGREKCERGCGALETAPYGWGRPWRVVLLFVSLTGALAVIPGFALAQDQNGQTPAPPQENPQSQESPKPEKAPEEGKKEEKKDETANPAQAAADKTKAVTQQAAEATKKVGQAALIKARDWEGGWLTGVYVEEGQTMTPLTRKQRIEIYREQTLTTPGAYMKRMFAAGIDQARGVPYQWDDGWDGYVERFASREGQFIAANSLAALGNAALKYEPRYDQCTCSGFWPRAKHAIMRNFLTYDESEVHLRPQWALYGGSFGGGLLSTAWKPHPRNAFAEGSRAMLGQAGYGALLNFFIEFSRDMNRKIGAKQKR
jgi:hypothetical protein